MPLPVANVEPILDKTKLEENDICLETRALNIRDIAEEEMKKSVYRERSKPKCVQNMRTLTCDLVSMDYICLTVKNKKF